MKKWDERRRFIIQHLSENGRFGGNVLDADFVDAYLEDTHAKFYLMPYGAHKCPQLGRDLSRMEREGSLSKNRVGVRNMAAMGFPKWVWEYRLNPWEITK